MKISVNWLKDYIKIDIPADELVRRMVDIGFDIEGVENQADSLKNFVIGNVVERIKHPNADKLSVCKVDTGSDVRQIVCGAPNVDAGQMVCVALPGAIIPNGGFEIKKSKIRGEESNGMICSSKELNLGDDKDGIMVLNGESSIVNRELELKVGEPFANYIGYDDVVIEIGVTPNRGDLLSHIGAAVEVGAAIDNGQTINDNIDLTKIKSSKEDIKKLISVDIQNPKGCYRYCGRIVKNIKVKESPEWLKKRLTAVGLRPINNIVDVTNFVMIECGQPLHAFDYDLIGGKKIVVKDSSDKQKFKTLDGKERELREGILLICDADKAVGLAGIMGGENSEITDNTKNVFIESAYFDPILTRKSSKYLGLQTDSSYRFERGVDIERTEWACNRAAQLIAELGEGEIAGGMIDEYPNKIEQRVVGLRVEYLNKVIGMEFEKENVKELLDKIGIEFVNESEGKLNFKIPFSRHEDLKAEVDLVEEVARLYGYKNIEWDGRFNFSSEYRLYSTEDFDYRNKLKNVLIEKGYKEIISNSLISEKSAKLFGEDYLSLLNPSNEFMNTFRNNLYIGALETVKFNFDNGAEGLKLFEIGDVLTKGEGNYKGVDGINDNKSILLTVAGEYTREKAGEKNRNFKINDLKTDIENLLVKLNVENYDINYYNYNGKDDLFQDKVEYVVGDKKLASIFTYSKRCLQEFDIDKPVISCEVY